MKNKFVHNTLSLLLAFIMLIGTGVSSLAAPTDPAETTNNYTKKIILNGGANGATYRLDRTGTLDEGGRFTEQETNDVKNYTITEGVNEHNETLQRGHYKLVPLKRAPEYALDQRAAEFDFPKFTRGIPQDITVSLKKNIPTVDFEAIKNNDENTPLETVTFNLKRVQKPETINEQNAVATWTPVDPASGYKYDVAEGVDFVTTTDGKISFTELREGKYELVEKQTVNGYELDTRKRTFTVEVEVTSANGTNTSTTVIKDKSWEAQDSNLQLVNYKSPSIEKKIEKTVESNENLDHLNTNVLTDFYYELKVKLPKDIQTYTKLSISDEFNTNLTSLQFVKAEYTDGSGELTLTDLVNITGQNLTADLSSKASTLQGGKELRLVVKAQLKGDTPASQNISNTFKLTYDNGKGANQKEITSNEATVKLTQGSVTFNKVKGEGLFGQATETKLSGAKFRLFKVDGNEPKTLAEAQAKDGYTRPNGVKVEDITTSDDGKVTFENLPFGKYVIFEIESPEGYKQKTNGIEVEITSTEGADTVVVTLNDIINYEEGTIQLNTGTLGLVGLAFTTLITGGAGIFLVAKRKKENQ